MFSIHPFKWGFAMAVKSKDVLLDEYLLREL